MKQQKKLITLFSTIAILLAFVLPLSSCRSNKVVVQSEHKTKERMFWQIDALDANGKKSTVYIQGTIHMGDERL
ncbi:MAG: hypothetical protein IKI31_06220, partial [Treponema sp.]|nr:hypothetical protein [Treponema sp.]